MPRAQETQMNDCHPDDMAIRPLGPHRTTGHRLDMQKRPSGSRYLPRENISICMTPGKCRMVSGNRQRRYRARFNSYLASAYALAPDGVLTCLLYLVQLWF